VRVLHVINSLAPGGAERLVSELLPALSKRGIDCGLFVLDSRGDAFSESLSFRGIKVDFAKIGGASPYSPMRLADIEREIWKRRPDIVHAHLGPSFHWCALASMVNPRRAFVATEHSSENRRMSLPFAAGIERFLHNRYARVTVVSEDSGLALRNWLGMGKKRIAVIPNGIELSRFSGKKSAAPDVVRELGLRIGIAMTARLVEAKDHGTAMRAIAQLPSEYCLVLMGEGEEGFRLRALAASLGIEDRCLFLGSRRDVPEVLAACKAYVQSSRIEGFGIAALEAMAAGLPVAASEAPGLGDLVRGAGLTFPVGDEGACAKAIKCLIEDPELRNRMIASGYERAKGYSIELCAEGYAALYREIARKGA
jgi:glycosyltransferase involved in cell wall biosynthesis